MMVVQLKGQATLEDFEAFVDLPENSDKLFEYINGEIVAVPSNPYASEVANLLSFFIRLFLMQNNLKGHITGADGGFMVGGNRYAPDVAYISYERQPQLAEKGYNPNPPELAVEVISDPNNSQEQATLRQKIVSYLAVGTVVWVVDTVAQTIEVYDGVRTATVYGIADTVRSGDWLPGFELAVKDIFPKE
ncbi:MAG: Uma2 family endonuclease, partial [Anaerolineaceae bacterium]